MGLRTFLKHTLRTRLLGTHPYNTSFNYNWVNVRPLLATFRGLSRLCRSRVVDLGAGLSPYYDVLARDAAIYVAIDLPSALPNEESRPIARAAGTLEAIPLAAGSMDTVLCIQVLSQVCDPARALREIARILKPGGHAILAVPHVSPLHSEPHDLYRFTPDGLRRLLAQAGLTPGPLHVQGYLFASFALCFAMSLVLTPVRDGQPMRLCPWRQLVFAPWIFCVNHTARLLDWILPFNRVPVNFVMVAEKPGDADRTQVTNSAAESLRRREQ